MTNPHLTPIVEDSLPDSPFPGIEAFTYARHRVFFSRDEESRALARSIVLHRGVLLFAASGTGKSSLINAGIIPQAMAEGFQPERIRVQPKSGQEIVVEPIRAFGDARMDILPSLFIGKGHQSERVVLSVEEFLATLHANAEAVSPLLIFDQFEEWVTLFEEAATEQNRPLLNVSREKIQNAISGIINDASLPVKVLIALREDYLANLAPLFKDVPSLPDNYLRLRPLTPEQLMEVIRKPYEEYPGAFAVELGPSLAQGIKDQFQQRVAGGDVQLTEVQIVCRTLFEHAVKGSDADQLFAEKGVQGILEAYLETTVNALTAAEREPALAVLSRLITSSGTRNVVSEDNLIRWLGTEENISAETVRTAVRNLEHRVRLIRCEPRRGVNYYEINSEFLVPWIQREAIARDTQRKVQALRRKEEKEHRAFRQKLRLRTAYAVTGGLVLLAIIAWKRGKGEQRMRLYSVAEALAVRSLIDSGEIGNLLARQAEAIHSREDSGHFSGVIGTALVNAQMTAAPPLARFDGNITSMSTDTAGRRLAAAVNGHVFLWNLQRPRGDPRQLGDDERLYFQSVSLSANGEKLVAGTRTGSVLVWQVDSSRADPLRLSTDTSVIYGVDISPDGRRVAAAAGSGGVRVWDIGSNPVSLNVLPTQGLLGWSVRFADDGKTLFTGAIMAGSGVRKWDLGAPRPRSVASLPGLSMAISPDGKWLATGEIGGKLRLWRMDNLTTPAHELTPHAGVVLSLAFSPDGSALVSTSGDSTVQLWSLQSTGPVRTMLGRHNGWVTSARFSHDGNSLLSAGSDGQLKWWLDIRGNKSYPVTIVQPQADSGTVSAASLNLSQRLVASVVLQPSRRALRDATASALVSGATRRGSVWLYDLVAPKGSNSVDLGADSSRTAAQALSADGNVLAVTGRGGAIRVLRRDKPGIELLFGQPQDSVRTIALSVAGQLLAAAGGDSIVRVWNTERAAMPPHILKGVTDPIRGLALSPDGTQLAAGGEGGTIRVWTVTQPDSGFERPSHEDAVRVLAYNSKGDMLAAGGDDGKVSVWNVSRGLKLVVEFPAGSEPVTSLVFSRDGRLVFAGSRDGTIRYWSIQEGNASPVRLNTQAGTVRAIALSTNADTLYSVGDAGTVLAWLINGPALAKRICDRMIKNLSFAEWRYYMPAEMRYELTCPEHGSPPANVEAIKKAIRRKDFDTAREMAHGIARLDSAHAYDVESAILFFQAEELARRKQVDSAVLVARRAGASTKLDSVDRRDGFDRVGLLLVGRAQNLADSGDFSGASRLVSKVRTFLPADSRLKLRSTSRIIEPVFLTPSMTLAKAGKVDSAFVAFQEARSLVGDAEIPALYWNNLCWYSSLWQRARQAMYACDQAVSMDPREGNYRDSRGLARALTGDRNGAISDFTFFSTTTNDATARSQRVGWIASLRRNENPFTPELLQALLQE